MACGIYSIVNKINGHRYIGSSKNIESRFQNHVYDLQTNLHFNRHLQNAWNRYGRDQFELRILQICDPVDLIKIEQMYLDMHQPEYNKKTLAGGGTVAGSLSQESREKKSRSMMGNLHFRNRKSYITSAETRKKLSDSKLGHIVSQETRDKISSANRNRVRSEEFKLKVSTGIKRWWKKRKGEI